jgi:tRNA pseudouridine38-40 synthase
MFEHLDEHIGLKVDDLVILDELNVREYLNNHQELFQNINFTDHYAYQMKYGYTGQNNPIKIHEEAGVIKRIVLKTKNYPKNRIKLDISYDGTFYHGFQIQENLRTIQGQLSTLISQVLDKPVLVQGASRTDAGVHALQQVIHFDDEKDLDTDAWLRYLNHQLDADILVKKVEKTHPLFHSRYDVKEKEYFYQIKLGERDPLLKNYAWHVEYLDFIRLDDQLKKLIGTHDFTSFSKGNSDNSCRTIYDAGYKLDDDILKIYLSGNGFLRYMVRLIIAQVISYATKKTEKDILEIIALKSREFTKDLAPASGLYLSRITY